MLGFGKSRMSYFYMMLAFMQFTFLSASKSSKETNEKIKIKIKDLYKITKDISLDSEAMLVSDVI